MAAGHEVCYFVDGIDSYKIAFSIHKNESLLLSQSLICLLVLPLCIMMYRPDVLLTLAALLVDHRFCKIHLRTYVYQALCIAGFVWIFEQYIHRQYITIPESDTVTLMGAGMMTIVYGFYPFFQLAYALETFHVKRTKEHLDSLVLLFIALSAGCFVGLFIHYAAGEPYHVTIADIWGVYMVALVYLQWKFSLLWTFPFYIAVFKRLCDWVLTADLMQ